MQRQEATKYLRDRLDEFGLNDWHIRLTTDVYKPYLGLCSYKDKTIILNAMFIDQHEMIEVGNTINHEIAHALTPGCAHNETWAAKAKELGCDNVSPCVSYSLSADVIDAIRSGAQLKIEYETEIVRKPKYTISRLQDKCPTCGKVAKELSRFESADGSQTIITLECFHLLIKRTDSTSPFHTITFDGDKNCKHIWNKTVCTKCDAKKLFPFQIKGAQSLERADGKLGIFDEMGLGKTIQANAYLKFHEHDAWPFLWITRSGIKYQHVKELIRVIGKHAFPQVITSGKERLIEGMNVICSYDIFRRLDMQMFIDHGFKCLVLDECQAVKNPDSARTGIIRQIAKHIPKFIPLSGTPWKNRGSELFVVYNILDATRFYSFENFKKRWVRYYWDGNKQKEGGISDPKAFQEYVKDLCIRRERVEVLPELPIMSRNRFIAEVPEYARNAYSELEDKLISDYNDAVIGGEEETFASKVAQNQTIMIMRQIVGIAKVPSTIELAQEFLTDTERKLVVFVHHKECAKQIIEQMTKWCADERLPQPLQLSAQNSSIERFEIQEKFNSPNYRLLIASTLASGEGLNLQSCSDCIMHERQWNPANEEQAEGRFIRIGQQATSINATYVHADDTCDTILDGIVERKRVEFHNTMNKGQMNSWNEGSILKELIEQIAAKKKNGKKK